MTSPSLAPLAIKTTTESVYVDGDWRPSQSPDRVLSINPTTEEQIGSAPDGDSADVDAAVRAAREALGRDDWAKTTMSERAVYLNKMADRLQARMDEMSPFLTAENGMSVNITGRMNAGASAAQLRYYAQLGESLADEEVRHASIVRREPIGVAGLIVPWNGPVMLAFNKIAPALMAGCTVVVKPAGETPLSAAYIIDAVEYAGLLRGVVNVVTGGRETGAMLVAHPGVDKVGFTGSTAAGRTVARVCGEAMKPCTLELGGKSAAIILEDADLDVYLAQLPMISMGGSGQGCVLATRVLVSRKRYDDLKDGVRQVVSKLKVGDPMDRTVAVGPLAMERQRTRVEGYIRSGIESGATLFMGGGRPAHLDKGYFVEPTVFTDVDPSSRIAQEEIFGPVIAVTPFDSEDEAVALANDSSYGLAGVVYTADIERGTDVARRVQTGTIGVNAYATEPWAPFGGVKQSGMGREKGPEGLASYVQYKSIYRADLAGGSAH